MLAATSGLAGYYCPANSYTGIPCAAGQYSTAGSRSCTACAGIVVTADVEACVGVAAVVGSLLCALATVGVNDNDDAHSTLE